MKKLFAWLRGDADMPARGVDLAYQPPPDRVATQGTNCREREPKCVAVEMTGTESLPRAKQEECPFCGVIRNLERQGTGMGSGFKAKYWYVSTHSCRSSDGITDLG